MVHTTETPTRECGSRSPAAAGSGKKRKSLSSPLGQSPASRIKRKAAGASSPRKSSPKHFKASPIKSPIAKKSKNFRESEELTIRLNVYDLVWDKSKKGGNNNAGLVDLGLGFFHTGLELWGKELSFGHSKRFKSGVFAVKPRKADELMPHTMFKETIEMATVSISRYSVDKLLNRLSVKYTSDAYHVLRNNCNHFTDELCQALCGKNIPEWVNRPAKMGSSALDALNAPFEAVSAVIKVFTPSKKANQPSRTYSAPSDEACKPASALGIQPTQEQLDEIGQVPPHAEQISSMSRLLPD